MPEPFTPERVVEICTAMRDRDDFRHLASKTIDRRALLLGEMPVDIEGVSEMLEERSSALRHHRTQFNNKISGSDIGIAVAARSPDAAAITAAQNAENLDFALVEKVREETDTDRRSTDQQVSYGCGVFHFIWDGDARKKLNGTTATDVADLRKVLLEGASFTDIPWTLEAPSLGAVFWEPDRSSFCEIGERKVSELKQDFPDNKDLLDFLTSGTLPTHHIDTHTDYTTTVDAFHLETADHIYDVVQFGEQDAEPILVERRPNLVGRPWYVLIPGHDNSEDSVADKYEPLIGPLYTIVDRLNVLGTLLSSGAMQTGRPMYQLVTQGSHGATDYLDYMRKPANERPVLRSFLDDAIQTPPDGYEYTLFPVPDHQWLMNAYRDEQQKLRDYGFPSALSTDAPQQGDTTSGAHAARQMEAASGFLEYGLTMRALAWKQIFQLMHDVIQALDVTVTVPVQLKAQGKGPRVQEITKVKPDDLKEHRLEVTLKSEPASVAMAKEENIARRLEAGLISKQSAMEQLYDDPSDEQKRIDLQQIRDPIKEMALQDAIAIVQQRRAAAIEEAQAAAGVGLPPEANPQGGPTPGRDIRTAAPALGGQPGLGDPLVNPEQAQQGVNPVLGTQPQGVA